MKYKLYILFIFTLVASHLFSQIAISGYNHVGLSVEDINKSTHFYKNIIGLKPIAVPSYLKIIRSWFQIAPGQELHLLAGRKDPVTNNHSNGAHFSFSISDASKIANYLDKENIKYIKQQRFDGAWQIYVTDPDGYVIELNEPKVNWTSLFNGSNLKSWEIITPKKSSASAFSIQNEHGEDLLMLNHDANGMLISKNQYHNFHLQLEYKWNESGNEIGTSGIVYHIQNLDKGIENINAQKFDIIQNGTGSYSPYNNAGATININENEQGQKNYRKTGNPMIISNSGIGRNCNLSKNQEYQVGEWNILDLYCYGDVSAHMINGKTVMVLKKSWLNIKGVQHELSSGKIALSADGAGLVFKNIKISSLNSMPENIINQDNH